MFLPVEVTFFVEATDELKPVFLIGGWTRSNPIITHNTQEEQPIGSNVLRLSAQDPLTMSPIGKFMAKTALPRQFAMDPVGNIVITEKIDYETIQNKVSVSVGVMAEGGLGELPVVNGMCGFCRYCPLWWKRFPMMV